jgi:carbon starvation protein CstA
MRARITVMGPEHLRRRLLIGAVIGGHWFAQSVRRRLAHVHAAPDHDLMAIYGFVASVLPVWLLLTPRDYLSTYMKLGTIAALIVGIFHRPSRHPVSDVHPVLPTAAARSSRGISSRFCSSPSPAEPSPASTR